MKNILKNKYAQTPNSLLNDENISFKAKGLYGYIQSKPDEWEFSAKNISLQSKENISSVQSGLKELEVNGFLKRVKYKNNLGHWGIVYLLTEIPFQFSHFDAFLSEFITVKKNVENPISENHTTENPVLENPTLGFPILENQQTNISNKESSNKESSNKEIVIPKSFKNWTLEEFVKSITDENKTSLPKSELKQFYDYWREKDSKGKFKFQNQKSWETELRLNTWERNYKKFNTQETKTETSIRSKAL